MRDDMETNTLNVIFDGSDDTDNKDSDDYDFEEKLDKVMKELDDDSILRYKLKRYSQSR